MRSFKLTLSQSVCLAFAVLGIVLTVVGGHKGILILISIGICMPFYSLMNTGKFTYFPSLKINDEPIRKREGSSPSIKSERHNSVPQNKPKEYSLRDIPYPPKRNVDQPIKNLPYGNGLSPVKHASTAPNQKCALLAKTATPLTGAPSSEAMIGKTLPLFPNAETVTTEESEETFVQTECIFL